MEIKTSSEIAEHLDSIDTLNPKYDKYSEAYSDAKWIKIKDIIFMCEEWFDAKRKNNDLWLLSQDELVSKFLDYLENKFDK